mmetsp:Transcript_55813/g.126850  ORF Transcript_55813/g.126850 Transcript_55813/m.126850 type:complete len:203 (+) Transcript_55813:1944-2552(+)
MHRCRGAVVAFLALPAAIRVGKPQNGAEPSRGALVEQPPHSVVPPRGEALPRPPRDPALRPPAAQRRHRPPGAAGRAAPGHPGGLLARVRVPGQGAPGLRGPARGEEGVHGGRDSRVCAHGVEPRAHVLPPPHRLARDPYRHGPVVVQEAPPRGHPVLAPALGALGAARPVGQGARAPNLGGEQIGGERGGAVGHGQPAVGP